MIYFETEGKKPTPMYKTKRGDNDALVVGPCSCMSVLGIFCSGHMYMESSAKHDDNEGLNLALHIQVFFCYFTGIIACLFPGGICN